MSNKTNDGVNQNAKREVASKVVNIVAIVLTALLLPVLVFNCVLIVKGMINKDEVPAIGSTMPLIVITESMEDTIKGGDLIFCKKIDAKDVKKGDVIAFFDPEGDGSTVVTHRVISLEYEDGDLVGFRTQGDNNDIEDRMTVPVKNLVGIWTGTRIGLLGNVLLFTQSTPGLIVCIFLPIAAFVVYEILSRKKQDKAKQDNIDDLKAELELLKQQQAANQASGQAGADADNNGDKS